MKKVTEVAEYLEKTSGIQDFIMKQIPKFVEEHGLGLGAALGVLGGAGIASATGLAGAIGGSRQGDTASYRLNRGINSLYDRIRADEVASESFAKGIGSGAAETALGLTKDMLSKTLDTFKEQTMASPARNFIFKTLKSEDPVLADTDDKTLLEAYHTMSRIAPNLSQDKNAVRSFLTQAATSGNGLDFTTIKGIADAELAVARARNPNPGGKQ